MSQYFENDNSIISEPKTTVCWCGEHQLKFITDHGVFSYGEIDDASLKLVKVCQDLNGSVLDLGCGYGFIGIYLKKKYPIIDLYQTDINERALSLCKTNCNNNNVTSTILCSDGLSNIDIDFDNIILNPPIHAGKDVCFRLISESYDHLKKAGTLYVVVRKKHGAESYLKYLDERNINYLLLDKKERIYILRITK